MGTRITELPALGDPLADDDLVEIIDVSDVSVAVTGTNKQATMAQVLAYANTLVKFPVVATVTAAMTLAADLIEGELIPGTAITAEPGMRVAATAQPDPGENGIWVVQSYGDPPVRAGDFAAEMSVSGALFVSLSPPALWACTNLPGAGVVGTNAITLTRLGIEV